MSTQVNEYDTVLLHFALRFNENGETIESSFEDNEPIEVCLNEDQLPDGMEQQIIGCQQGERKTVTLNAEQGYGLRNAENIHDMQLSDFSDEVPAEIGMVIAFEAPQGEEIPGTVLAVEGDIVKVDFNHSLAGHSLDFEFEILEINPA